ncbi:hypothetical protein [Leptospira sp. GIMC2001]|uniref:hypothetical protein n=1 Tax=Leptospira sp. GIMC2001 TaxID=1513297 RepID=UPI00234A51DC|nr:hypothetical protein [Leptospira sp. GIMC2001]WCL47715.1 hypothetical protein O4O04_00225 [Leptospira sp. GIMC2001]
MRFNYESLESPQNFNFAVLQEFLPKSRKFSYTVIDEKGKIHEFTESVDAALSRRMRVGDTVPVYRKTFVSFGRKEIMSKLKNNSRPFNPLNALSNLVMSGILFSTFACFVSLCGMLFIKSKK